MYKSYLKLGIFFSIISLLLKFGVSSALANGGCVPVYGGGVQCPRPGVVLVDKKVLNPATNFYVDNLGPNDPKYRPEQIVTFQIVIQNSGDQTLDTVNVTDILPQYVDFMSGPGSYDSKTKTVNWTVNNLLGGASQVFYVKARIVHPALLPVDRTLICPISTNPQPINIVDAVSSNQKDHDESRFCIQKEMIVPVVPKAGPENWILTIVGLIGSLMIGLNLRKKAIC